MSDPAIDPIDAQSVYMAMHMPPAEAVAFLKQKGLVVTNSWRDLWQAAHARAFTVARSAGYDILADIRSALTNALENGESYEVFAKDLIPRLQAKGWWGKAIDTETGEVTTYHPNSGRAVELGSPRRLRLIYGQNIQTSLMAGRYRAMMQATGTHPYWQYIAILDSQTRPSHRAMHNRVFRYDDPAWSIAYPPCGWNCRCRVRPLSAAALQDEGLTAESAAGHISTVDVPQKDNTVIPTKQIKLPGMDKPFRPDPGWDYNPAEHFLEGQQ